ncbi:Beta-catenin-like protein 1 [Amphibalanus amphitrite]|uniref:Beta-catenin-like protein 1 n=1 Tax=Amphibalanus amphitrite TaxID=1232801 RepID=A0A6A4W1M3_AMPAM|nr:Beta-catenin-like protein 1 [Amphibalanus amphitrite]
MPASDRRLATATLSGCREFNEKTTVETAQCAARTRRLSLSTRCRDLNAHLELAEARLDRLEEFLLLRQLESVQPLPAKCSEEAAAEVRSLESQRHQLRETVAEAVRHIEEQEEKQRAVERETDTLREEKSVLDCELERLETEQRLLERQLELQTAALDELTGQRQARTELTAALEAADAERTRAAELCRRQTEEHQRRLETCRQEAARLETRLQELPEPQPEAQVALERELSACHGELDSCAVTASACAADLETASTHLIQREMAALAERGRLQGCQRELIAGRGRFNQCRTSARALFGQIRVLQREARGSAAAAGRLDQCYSESSMCGSRAAQCAQQLADLSAGRDECRTQTADWRSRWFTCNTSVASLEEQRLAPLRLVAQRLEEVVNETVAHGRRCEEDDLHTRADRGFAEEELRLAQAALAATKQTLDECQLECWVGQAGEGDGAAEGEPATVATTPDKNTKRHLEGEDEEEEAAPRRVMARTAPTPSDEPTPDEILRLVDEEPQVEPLDENLLKRLILQLEKRTLRNQEMRTKYADAPERFLDSELELHESIQALHAVATGPELYPRLVGLGAVSSLLALLAHENTDIAIAVIDLLQELTDVETDTDEGERGADRLAAALLEREAVAVLVHTMERLDETVTEEAAGVHSALAIVENVTEVRPSACLPAAQQGLMAWLLRRLQRKAPFDANKLYASEMLSVLVQSHEENRTLLGELDGIDVLLQQLAYYKRHDPSSSEEQECMENMFDALCSVLLLPENKDRFLRGEGLQLMNLMLREKKLSRNGALKVLNYATSGPSGADNCNKFVEILGLRTLFPLFMHTPRKHKRKGLSVEEHEEHVVSILCALLRHCRGQLRQRIVAKFTENDCEKVDRLMELHFKYLDKVYSTDAALESERGLEDDELYVRRLEGGLFTLQLVDFIVLEACAAGAAQVKQRVMQMLNIRNASVKTIRNIMREYAGNLGDTDDSEERQAEQQRILQLVDKF